jgi:hypothetical protein
VNEPYAPEADPAAEATNEVQHPGLAAADQGQTAEAPPVIYKYCLTHGIVEPSHNCKRRPARTRRYFDAARRIRDNATTCALCAKGHARTTPGWQTTSFHAQKAAPTRSTTSNSHTVHATADADKRCSNDPAFE